MSEYIRRNVLGIVAIFIALGGTAWAATELEKNEVKSKHIGKGQVKNPDLADNAVTSPRVANGSLLEDDFAAGQLPQGPPGERGLQGPQGPQGLTGPPGSNATINGVAAGGDLAGTYPNPQVQESSLAVGGDLQGSVAAAQVGESGLNTGGDLTGTVANAQIGTGAVGDTEIANGSLTVTTPASSVGSASVDGTGQPSTAKFVGFPVLEFDPLSDETLELDVVVPADVVAGNITARILQSSGVGSGVALWDMNLDRVRPESLDFVSTTTSVLAVNNRQGVQSTGGEVEEINFGPVSSSTVTGGDLIRLRLTRDANDSGDSLAGDAVVFAVEVTFPTAR